MKNKKNCMSFNIGDRVVMNDKYRVPEKNKDKIFIVRSEPWNCCGTMVVFLEGYSGGYAVDGLTVKIGETEECQK